MKPVITVESLRELLAYDVATGVFRWRVRAGRAGNAGEIAGSLGKNGYISIYIRGRMYRAHRVAWAYVHGVWPKEIDHRDGDRINNRIVNLRECVRHENLENQRLGRRNTSGLFGASWSRRDRRWRASIGKHGKCHYLGDFGTKEEAHAAYLVAKKSLHKFQPALREQIAIAGPRPT